MREGVAQHIHKECQRQCSSGPSFGSTVRHNRNRLRCCINKLAMRDEIIYSALSLTYLDFSRIVQQDVVALDVSVDSMQAVDERKCLQGLFKE